LEHELHDALSNEESRRELRAYSDASVTEQTIMQEAAFTWAAAAWAVCDEPASYFPVKK
jgi:hypothetical protein